MIYVGSRGGAVRGRDSSQRGCHPRGLVPTPGVVYHGLDRDVPADALEPAEVMAEAASRAVQRRSGGVDRSNSLMPDPSSWAVLQLIRRAS